jgi:photosystem II stability/assembly factor-like uncharacterized protein
MRCLEIEALDASTAWVAGSDEATTVKFLIYKTTNGGSSWTKQYDQNVLHGLGIRFFDVNNGLAIGGPDDNWTILTTTNGGTTWNPVPESDFPACETRLVQDPENPEIYHVQSNESGVVGLATYGDHAWFVSHISTDNPGKPNYIYRSTDRGYHWTKHAFYLSGGEAAQAYIAFKDAANGVVVGEEGTRGYTSDGGVTWTMTDQAPDYLYSITHVPSTDAFLAVGDEKITHISYDIGRTWTRYFTVTSAYFLSVTATETKAWASGGNGLVSVWNNSVPLPVELIGFTAASNGSEVILRWSTATETNNLGFTVQRRSARESNSYWQEIGFVDGHGTSSAPHTYSFIDATASGTAIYRLKQTDRDGKSTYSPEREVSMGAVPSEFMLSQNYPNPFNPTTSFIFSVPEPSYVTIRIFDQMGREVGTVVDAILPPGRHLRPWTPATIAGGVYYCRMTATSPEGENKRMFVRTNKVVLMK